jgi:hypothetical protein
MPGIALATQVSARAEERFLRRLPFIFGALTAGVVLVAGVLVQAHVEGRLTFDQTGYQARLSSQVSHLQPELSFQLFSPLLLSAGAISNDIQEVHNRSRIRPL